MTQPNVARLISMCLAATLFACLGAGILTAVALKEDVWLASDYLDFDKDGIFHSFPEVGCPRAVFSLTALSLHTYVKVANVSKPVLGVAAFTYYQTGDAVACSIMTEDPGKDGNLCTWYKEMNDKGSSVSLILIVTLVLCGVAGSLSTIGALIQGENWKTAVRLLFISNLLLFAGSVMALISYILWTTIAWDTALKIGDAIYPGSLGYLYWSIGPIVFAPTAMLTVGISGITYGCGLFFVSYLLCAGKIVGQSTPANQYLMQPGPE